MQSFVLSKGALLEPFHEPVAAAWILRGTLRAEQARTLGLVGASAPEDLPPDPGWEVRGPALVVEDDTWFSVGALRAFLQRCRGVRGPATLGLVEGPVTRWFGHLGGPTPTDHVVPHGVHFVPAGARLDGRELGSLPVVPVDPGGLELPGDKRGPKIPTPERLVVKVAHWSHLLMANLMGFAAGIHDQGKASNLLKILWAALRARSLNPHAIASRLNRVGRGCVIHPSAVIEGCFLGDRVHVGANAVLQGCVIGDGCVVEELSTATLSVMAPAAVLQRMGILRFSVAGPGASIGGSVQLSVLGRDASFKHGSVTMDQPLGRSTVGCLVDGRVEDSGLPYLGCCLGNRALVGSGVWLAPGREVPNDTWIIRPPGDTVLSVPPGLARARVSWVSGGRVVQVPPR